MFCSPKITLALSVLTLTTMTNAFSEETQTSEILTKVGYFPYDEEEEVARNDRDSNIPTLYDKNRMTLMRQRDRWIRNHGMCYPPPGVLVSPQITLPPRNSDGCYAPYDPRNPPYRSARD